MTLNTNVYVLAYKQGGNILTNTTTQMPRIFKTRNDAEKAQMGTYEHNWYIVKKIEIETLLVEESWASSN